MDKKELKIFINQFNKDLGDEGTLTLGCDLEDPFIERLSTGSLLLDCALGGGLTIGLTEFIGPESSGKTTMALKAAVECQKKYGESCNISYVAAEGPLNVKWAKQIGVSLNDNFMVLRASHGEAYLNAIKDMIDSNKFKLIIIDSIPAFESLSLLEEDIGKMEPGKKSRLVASFVRRCIYNSKGPEPGVINKTIIIAINQFYSKIGGFSPYGDPKDYHGGRALKHAKFAGVELNSGEAIEEGTGKEKTRYGKTIKFRINKCKTGAPEGSIGIIDLYSVNYGNFLAGSINTGKDYRLAGVKAGLITLAGGYFKFEDKNYRADELDTLLRTDESFRTEFRKKVLCALGFSNE